MALDVPKFAEEMKHLTDGGVPAPHIIVSERTQLLMPYHVLLDSCEEERLAGKAFGSTKSGIAPFYSDKYAKYGIQVADLWDETRLRSVWRPSAPSKMSCLSTSTTEIRWSPGHSSTP